MPLFEDGEASRSVDDSQLEVNVASILGKEGYPWSIVRSEVRVVPLVAIECFFRSLHPYDITRLLAETLLSQVQAHELSSVYSNLLNLLMIFVDLKNVVRIEHGQDVVRYRVRRGWSSDVLGSLWLHTDMQVVVLVELHAVSLVLEEHLGPFVDWVVLQRDGVHVGLDRV